MPVKSYRNDFWRMDDVMRAAAQQVVKDTLNDVESNLKIGMAEPKAGALYPNGHQASAPGEYPAIDTGALVNSIGVEMTGPLRGIIYEGQEYAVHLEYGTVYMAPRPHMVPAVESVRQRFIERMRAIGGRLK
jgi:hypothetical protein